MKSRKKAKVEGGKKGEKNQAAGHSATYFVWQSDLVADTFYRRRQKPWKKKLQISVLGLGRDLAAAAQIQHKKNSFKRLQTSFFSFFFFSSLFNFIFINSYSISLTSLISPPFLLSSILSIFLPPFSLPVCLVFFHLKSPNTLPKYRLLDLRDCFLLTTTNTTTTTTPSFSRLQVLISFIPSSLLLLFLLTGRHFHI